MQKCNLLDWSQTVALLHTLQQLLIPMVMIIKNCRDENENEGNADDVGTGNSKFKSLSLESRDEFVLYLLRFVQHNILKPFRRWLKTEPFFTVAWYITWDIPINLILIHSMYSRLKAKLKFLRYRSGVDSKNPPSQIMTGNTFELHLYKRKMFQSWWGFEQHAFMFWDRLRNTWFWIAHSLHRCDVFFSAISSHPSSFAASPTATFSGTPTPFPSTSRPISAARKTMRRWSFTPSKDDVTT